LVRAAKFARPFVLVLAVLAGCGGTATTAPPSSAPVAKPAAPSRAQGPASDSFHASRIALVPAGTFGPYLGVRPESVVAAWAADVSGKRRWITRPIGESGAPLAEPKTIADAATEIDLVAVRPLGWGKPLAFVLLTSSHAFSGERVDAIALGPGGELLGGPNPIAERQGDVVWVDAFSTDHGALALWAVRHEDRASIHGVALGTAGEMKAEPAVLASDVRSWQVARTLEGIVIAAVGAGKSRNERGPITATFVDYGGRVEKKSVVVNPSATALLDLDIAFVGRNLVFAWTDDRDLEPRLYGAVMDGSGTIVKPAAPLGPPFGPQAVVRIVAAANPDLRAETVRPGRVFLAWENLLERTASSRPIRVTTLSPDEPFGLATSVIDFASSDGSVPELATTSRQGLAALTLAPACKVGASCAEDRVAPTFAELDDRLTVIASEPLHIDELGGDVPDLAWGLTCRPEGCFALAAGPKSPAPVYTVTLGPKSKSYRPAAYRLKDVAPPRASAVEAVGKSDSVSDLAAVRVGKTTLVTWVTYFDPTTPLVKPKKPAPDGKYEPIRAVLHAQVVPDDGARPDVGILSYRAHSFGGVAVAAGEPSSGDSLVVWSAVDNKQPQVFVTLVGADGKKKIQKMLTHTKGGVGEVAVAFAGDGWFVAWIDERTGTPQVYVTKVDDKLRQTMPERHVGTAASTATGVQLLVRGDSLVVAWSDARGQTPGVSDIFVARLTTKDLSPVGPERAVVTTAAHSRSPAISAFGEGAAVAWVEDAPANALGRGAALMLARLDSGAEPVAGSVTTAELVGSPQGVGITCAKDACRVVTPVSAADGAEIQALEWRGQGPPRGSRMIGLTTPPKGAVAPVVIGDAAFYVDESSRDARVRRVSIDWK
jgi:hypothetical protein